MASPKNTKMASELAGLYGMSAPGSCAFTSVNGSTTLNLECPMVHEQICAASANLVGRYLETGQNAAADQTLRRAVESFRCGAELLRR